MTQGMVCHETYKDATTGDWVYPDQLRRDVVAEKVGFAENDDQSIEALTNAETGNRVVIGSSVKMSKSQRNIVDPEGIIDAYGADTARLFMLSDSPPERDLEWTESGIDGAWRYVSRLWRMITLPRFELAPVGMPVPDSIAPAADMVYRAIHKTVAAVSQDLDRFRFNKAVARIRELTNALDELVGDDDGSDWVLRQGLETAVRLFGPMMPHLAEELWCHLGHDILLADTPWPEVIEALLEEESATIAVQVNGKLRGTLDLPRDSEGETAKAAALALPNVAKAVGQKEVRKVIVVPNRIINVVI
jgi:leucyl-tRNA synthetase